MELEREGGLLTDRDRERQTQTQTEGDGGKEINRETDGV